MQTIVAIIILIFASINSANANTIYFEKDCAKYVINNPTEVFTSKYGDKDYFISSGKAVVESNIFSYTCAKSVYKRVVKKEQPVKQTVNSEQLYSDKTKQLLANDKFYNFIYNIKSTDTEDYRVKHFYNNVEKVLRDDSIKVIDNSIVDSLINSFEKE